MLYSNCLHKHVRQNKWSQCYDIENIYDFYFYCEHNWQYIVLLFGYIGFIGSLGY